jgi:hypothetical protein
MDELAPEQYERLVDEVIREAADDFRKSACPIARGPPHVFGGSAADLRQLRDLP